jgi:hypothetical protein
MSGRYRVTHGAVTVQTTVTAEGARAWVDVAPGKLVPEDVPASEVEMLLRQGRIEAVEDEPEPEENDEQEEETTPPPPSAPPAPPAPVGPTPEPEPVPERPAKSAHKADWVAYAQAVDPETGGLDELTKDQLIELYGGEGDGA